VTACLVFLLAAAGLASAQRKSGSPLDHLPRNIVQITQFGERADLSPDSREVAFISKSFGDAMVYDLRTRAIRCLTCNVPGAAFLRVMHLPRGGYLLTGPAKFTDIETGRRVEAEIWYLSAEAGSKPIRLGERISEGIAISRTSDRVAWAVTHRQDPSVPEGRSYLVMARLDRTAAAPRLVDKRTVYDAHAGECAIEAQDFYARDSRMTFTCNEPDGAASVMTLDIATGQAVNCSRHPGSFNEVEAIFPDERWVTVEADRHAETYGGPRGESQIDIWKLRLDSEGKDFARLTRFNDYEGWVASNPVISRDGRFMVFQAGRSDAEAGAGFGLFLYTFR
jgi:hypothetical protein